MSGMSRESYESLIELAERCMLGELETEAFARFEQQLLSDPQSAQAMLEYIQQMGMMHMLYRERQRFADRVGESSYGEYVSILETLLPTKDVQAVRPFDEADPAMRFDPNRSAPPAWKRWSALAGAIAAMVLLTATVAFFVHRSANNTGLVLQPNKVQLPQQPVAYLTAQRGASWELAEGQPAYRVGAPLHAGQRLTLTAGFAELTTRRGAKAILEAPCEIELLDNDNALYLHQGKLVGICEVKSSRGFVVQTPSARLTDVGTRFGVIYDGDTRTRVIEGEVFASVAAGDQPSLATRLVAGQSAVIDESALQVVSVERLEDRFVTRWDAVARPPEVAGEIRFERAMPTDLRIHRFEADLIQLFPERSAIDLAEDMTVTFTEPGRYDSFSEVSARLSKGVRVDSYLVHMDTVGGKVSHYQATIRFDRPIVGIIATSKHLAATNDRFALPGTLFQSMVVLAEGEIDSSGLEASQITGVRDAVRLSDDRRELTLDLHSGDANDQIRILVQSEDQLVEE